MSTTALMPVDPSVSPQQANRVLTIRADLLPPEIRDGRRARRTRTLIVILLAATVAVLSAWYWQAADAKQTADDEYNDTFQTLTKVRSAQKTDELKALVEYQEGGKDLNTELTTVLERDLSWTNLTKLIRDRATDTDVKIAEVSASLTDLDSGAAATDEVGTVTVSGQAANKRVVADYVNELGDLKDLVNPFVTSVANAGTGVSFNISITITKEALCGRFTTDCPSGGE